MSSFLLVHQILQSKICVQINIEYEKQIFLYSMMSIVRGRAHKLKIYRI